VADVILGTPSLASLFYINVLAGKTLHSLLREDLSGSKQKAYLLITWDPSAAFAIGYRAKLTLSGMVIFADVKID
jgi:hypothetical protein